MNEWTSFNLKVAGIMAKGNQQFDSLLEETKAVIRKIEYKPLSMIDIINETMKISIKNWMDMEDEFERANEVMRGMQWEVGDTLKIRLPGEYKYFKEF